MAKYGSEKIPYLDVFQQTSRTCYRKTLLFGRYALCFTLHYKSWNSNFTVLVNFVVSEIFWENILYHFANNTSSEPWKNFQQRCTLIWIVFNSMHDVFCLWTIFLRLLFGKYLLLIKVRQLKEVLEVSFFKGEGRGLIKRFPTMVRQWGIDVKSHWKSG